MEWAKQKNAEIKFLHVNCLNIQSFDFWGPVQHIYFVEVLDAKLKIDGIYNRFCKENKITNPSELKEDEGKIEVILTLKSGNEIDIICEEIEYNERENIS